MSMGDKKYLVQKLTETRLATHVILKGVDLEIRVYTDTDWRIRDILGHLATWDREVAKSLRAFSAGNEYFIPDIEEDESEYNEQAVLEQRNLSTQQIYEEWEQAHDDFREAVRIIPSELFPGDVLYPWGDERGSIARLVDYMIEHEVEHRLEIENAIRTLAEN
ncbi:MAG: hypothetical protein GTO14_05330 [Anaerolineales bacterium]|nr:hypothetical protein [Anaerolineales bacterium]